MGPGGAGATPSERAGLFGGGHKPHPLFTLSSQLEWVETACFSAPCLLYALQGPSSRAHTSVPTLALVDPCCKAVRWCASFPLSVPGTSTPTSPSVVRLFCPGSTALFPWLGHAGQRTEDVCIVACGIFGSWSVPAAGTLTFSAGGISLWGVPVPRSWGRRLMMQTRV